MKWLESILGADDPPQPSLAGSRGAALEPRTVVLVLAAVALSAAGWLTWRAKRRQARRGSVVAVPVAASAPVDLDSATADRRPSDEWLDLAADFERQGDLRRAVRSVHLASLSRLAAATLLELHAAKTNRNYGRELARRAGHLHAATRLGTAFGGSVRGVEPIWFGEHEATADALDAMRRHDEALAEAIADGPQRPGDRSDRGGPLRGGQSDVAA
jgi:hypothetical protein